ncbi:MAG TPA: glycosyltransferase [Ktedonobacteraceae bacterium]|nr:glycosyltransferase [Ktedonobacteraceae bacterium]
MTDKTYRISVVVPTYKRPDLLHQCLAALSMQDLDPSDYEIIVVDDAACENTRRQVDQWAACMRDRKPGSCPVPAIRYIPVTGSHGPAVARNIGWRAAHGEIIAFTDDDCIPTPGWLSAGLATFNSGVVGVSGKLVMPLDHIPTDYERDAVQLEKSEFVTANCFYRRDVLERVGGFDEHFRMAWREDSDLFFTIHEHVEQCGYREGMCAALMPGRAQGVGSERPQHLPAQTMMAPASFKDDHIAKKPARKGDNCDPFHALIYVPRAVVIHPLRPAPWGISLKQQRKSMYNALLYKKHPQLYRQKVQAAPPWHYYCIVVALLIALASILAGFWFIALGAITAWMLMTGRFVLQRLRDTSHAPSHVLEMIVTSMLIPPLSIFWRIIGAIRFRVFFL